METKKKIVWTCPSCKRIFEKAQQPHSCRSVPLEEHFKNKQKAKELFEFLVKQVSEKVGPCKIISLPCCVHLFGSYDFLAALPKKDRLEIRFGLRRKLTSPRIQVIVPTSASSYKHCVDLSEEREIDSELMGWLHKAYHLKDL